MHCLLRIILSRHMQQRCIHDSRFQQFRGRLNGKDERQSIIDVEQEFHPIPKTDFRSFVLKQWVLNYIAAIVASMSPPQTRSRYAKRDVSHFNDVFPLAGLSRKGCYCCSGSLNGFSGICTRDTYSRTGCTWSHYGLPDTSKAALRAEPMGLPETDHGTACRTLNKDPGPSRTSPLFSHHTRSSFATRVLQVPPTSRFSFSSIASCVVAQLLIGR